MIGIGLGTPGEPEYVLDPNSVDAVVYAAEACIPRGGRVLVLGAGEYGREALYFARNGYSVTAVEIDPHRAQSH